MTPNPSHNPNFYIFRRLSWQRAVDPELLALHAIFTQHTDIIYAVNKHIEIAISRTVLPSGERAKNARSISLPSFRQRYLVAMATYLDKFVN